MALVFAIVQGALAWFGHRQTVAPAEAASKAGSDVNIYLQSKLRNSEVIESMGMLGNLRTPLARAAGRVPGAERQRAEHRISRVMAWSKFIRYSAAVAVAGAPARCW